MEINGMVFGGKRCHVLCSYCHRDVSMLCRVHCAECADFKLCTDCFSVGVQLLPHMPSHSYRVVDCLDVPIFSKDWTASEELLLIEGIEKCGAGNWKTIAEYISSTIVPKGVERTAKQVEEHYWELYMGVHGYCLPAKTISPSGEYVDTESLLSSKVANRCSVTEGCKEGEQIIRDRPVTNAMLGIFPPVSGALGSSSSSSQALSQGHAVGGESQQDKKKKFQAAQDKDKVEGGKPAGTVLDRAEELRLRHLALPGADLPGFLPLREDFDVEHDNDAEVLLAEMEFSPEDHPSERALKVEVIQIYNKKLDERNRRKRFAIDRGLVDFRKQQQAERKRNKEERDLVARLRVFSRFQTPEEHEAVVDGLIKARKLRNQIALYQHYRRMGVRTLEQGRQYDADRKKREIEFRAQKQRQQTPYLFQTGQVPSGNANRRRGQDDSQDGPDAKGLSGTNASGSGASAGAGTGSAGAGTGTVVGRGTKRSVEDSAAILAKAPGVDLLSTKEVELCAASGMLPLHFLAIKEALVREAYRNGSLTLEGMQRLVRIEQPKAAEVFDFFVREVGVLVGEGMGAGTTKRAREE